ncbi:hypothetical protein P691DRAFT_801893 [Macrolepiota fuliginosa MF-IS2]|uniref:Polysaccharide biosynthesis protein CapD-like domain-containing protein n=1 Tax=Macrolepiota fuliginosa MF-IS2 TaxID=1400762 RepID=A0A9P5XA92_9AGAR|nr:hypothetical protein P691DRAFT_801893 [Macrolepiota fuliginosa MF-IS2]
MHIILTGATGTVGSAVLRQCLTSPNVTKLSILSRREFALPTGDNLNTSKAEIIVHANYTEYPSELLDKLKGGDSCIWAQGISQSQVSKDEYVQITHDYPLAAAKAFSSLSNSGKFNFVYVSGEGADPTEKTFMYFGKVKGRAEKALLSLSTQPDHGALRLFNVRPGYVWPEEYDRARSLPQKFLDRTLAPILERCAPSQMSPTRLLASVLVDLATGDGEPLSGDGIEAEGRTLRNVAVRRLAGLND